MKYNYYTLLAFLAGFLIFSCGYAYAQTLPTPADPSRFDDRFNRPLSTPETPTIKPKEETPLSQKIPFAIEGEGFLLNKISLEGNTVISEDDLAFLFKDYIGQSANFDTLQHLTASITKYYRERGYFLAKALLPEQEIDNGELRVRIIEGYIDSVIIKDPENRLTAQDDMTTKALIKRIKDLKPLHGPSLERYILLFNQSSHLFVSSTLAASKSEKAGAIDLILTFDQNPSKIHFGINNHGSKFVGPGQIEASYTTGNIFSLFDTLTLQTTFSSPLEEVQYAHISYETLLSADGLKLLTSFSYSNSEPGENLKPLEVESDSYTINAELSYPYIKSRRTNIDFTGGFTIRNSATEFLDSELIDDKVRKITAGVSYNGQDDYNGINTVDFTLHQGLNILEESKTGASTLSRAQGRSDFTKATLTSSRFQHLPYHLSLISILNAQYSSAPLLSSEEFGYGGAEIGRAYDPSEITGDHGFSTSIELRYNNIPPLNNKISFIPHLFYDLGKVWNRDTNSSPRSAASAGFGSYYQIDQYVSGNITIAYPLTKQVATPVHGGTTGPRFLFSLNTDF